MCSIVSRSSQTSSISSTFHRHLADDENLSSHDAGKATPRTSSASDGHHKELPVLLDFSSVGLIGREQEVRIIQNLITKLCNKRVATISSTSEQEQLLLEEHQPGVVAAPSIESTVPRSLILISGPLGCGKSALARHFQNQQQPQCQDGRQLFFISGNFELEHQVHQPFAGIKMAMMELCQQILELPESNDEARNLSTLRRLLQQGLASGEVEVLCKIIPNFALVVNDDQEATDKDDKDETTVPQSISDSQDEETSHPESLSTRPSIQKEGSMAAATSAASNHSTVRYQEQSARLKFAFRQFIQIITTFSPVVCVLDDLQWADSISLDLLQSWMLDNRNSSLAIIGCYRANLLQGNPSLQAAIDTLEEKKRERSIRIIRLELENLTKKQIHEILCKVLESSCDYQNVVQTLPTNHNMEELVDVVYRKTAGNVFFVQQFLNRLIENRSLVKRDGSLPQTWSWDSGAIQATSVEMQEDGMLITMKQKLQSVLSASKTLPIAACLGATFSQSSLVLVMRGLSIHSDHSKFINQLCGVSKKDISESSIREMIQTCERERFIVESESSKRRALRSTNNHIETSKEFTFLHERLQLAAFAIVPEEKLSELQYRVGEVLLSGLPPERLEKQIFTVTGLLNTRLDLAPKHSTGNRRFRMVMLNYRAGQKAMECSAFQSALGYFKNAIQLLPEDHWKSHFRNSINIFSSAAECAYVTSNLELMRKYSTEIIQLDCSAQNKIRAYHVLIDSSISEAEQHRATDTTSLCLTLLNELDCGLPKRKLHRIAFSVCGLLRVKREARKWTDDTFRQLKVRTSDREEKAVMDTLGKLLKAGYLTKPKLLPMTILKSCRRTMQNGISTDSPPAFAMLSMVVGYFMKDAKSGQKIAHAALSMLTLTDDRVSMARTYLLLEATCFHWAHPIRDGMARLMEGYRLGMSSGCVDAAAWSIFHYLQMRTFVGTSLAVVDEEMATYSRVIKDFQQNHQFDLLLFTWQAVLNLRGLSSHTILLIGDAYDERNESSRGQQTELDPIRIQALTGNKLTLAAHFGDFEIGADIILETCDERLKKSAGTIYAYLTVFWGGLCCYGAAPIVQSKKKSRKYRRMGMRCRKMLKEWVQQGNPNCAHHSKFLDAEHALLHGRCNQAIKLYGEAIAISRRLALIHDEALACERLGLCLVREGGQARACFRDAIRLNTEWNAMKKVEMLQATFAELFD